MDSNKQNKSYEMIPIGVIRTSYSVKSETPIQPVFSPSPGRVELFPQYSDGLDDLDGFSHIFLVYLFDRSDNFQLIVKPFLDDHPHGLFSTRHPNRPNPIGISIVKIIGINGNSVMVEGIDVLDNTPLLDIKPYIPDFDVRKNVRTGWYKQRGQSIPHK
jgi:tRNA-Thr(GGU) m(6)t(6)A37 methyltransferase TsaA